MPEVHNVFQELVNRNPGKVEIIQESYSMCVAEIESGQPEELELEHALEHLRQEGIE